MSEIINGDCLGVMRELLCCPFCKEKDFDAIGLKSHLLSGDCKLFNETEVINRVFPQEREDVLPI